MSENYYVDCNSIPKKIARRISMCGSYLNTPETKLRRPPAKHVVNLPAAGNLDVIQGINEGLISEDAKVWGIEANEAVVKQIQLSKFPQNLNMEICHTNLSDFRPPQKIDMFLGDLMCRPNVWIGEFLVKHIVPHMKKRHSSISINLYAQMVHSGVNGSDPQIFRDMFNSNPDAYLSRNAWDLERFQHKSWSSFDLDENHMFPTPLAKSIGFNDEITTGFTRDITNNGCFLTFVSIHHFMMQTDFRYKGCYLYRQNRKGQNSGKMFTLYYDRG